MDKRFVQAHKEARWALWLTLLYLAAWLAAAYLPGVAIGFTGLPHWFEMACLLVPASEESIFEPQLWDADLDGLLDFARSNALDLHEDTIRRFEAEGGSQILAMSTCSAEFTDARTILLAWMQPSEPEQ